MYYWDDLISINHFDFRIISVNKVSLKDASICYTKYKILYDRKKNVYMDILKIMMELHI